MVKLVLTAAIVLLSAVCIILIFANRKLSGELEKSREKGRMLLGEKEKTEEENKSLRKKNEITMQHMSAVEKENSESIMWGMELIRKLSHELKMPMSIIKGYADILTDNLLEDEEQRNEYLEKIKTKVDFMDGVITSYVNSSATEKESPVKEGIKAGYSYCDILEIIRDVADEFKMISERKSIEIIVSTNEEQINMYCDPVKMRQVITNLVNNSVKYMEKEGTIQIVAAYSEKNEITLIVRDNGNGLAKEKAASVFEYGTQFHSRDDNHGLGLYICKENVQEHGGEIWCKSDVGKGMTTYILLPSKPQQKQDKSPDFQN
ncbi:MAG: HAMP domain-containing histidine kinase [Clostridia bacterium]|nr:HAMP domain-containing histidine kinase [Clostridia bacterium]